MAAWLDEAVSAAEKRQPVLPGDKRIPAWYLGPLNPDRFLALAEVVKAARKMAEQVCERHWLDLEEALARLEEQD